MSRNFYLPMDPRQEVVRPQKTATDPILQYEPLRMFVAEEFWHGRLALWNPYNFCGSPLFGTQYSPFQVFYYLFPYPWAHAWIQLLKSVIVGVGAYFFFRKVLSVNFWPAGIGAACYPLTGFLWLWATYPLSNACVWLPWLLLAVDACVRRPGVWRAVPVACVTALILTEGTIAAMAPHLLLTSGIYLVWSAFDQFGLRHLFSRSVFARTATVTMGWVLGFLLTMPYTLHVVDYLRTSNRVAQRRSGFVDVQGQGAATLPQFVFPFWNGDKRSNSKYFGGTAGNCMESTSTAYAGLLVVAFLAPIGMTRRKHRSMTWLWFGMAGFGIIYHLDIPLISEFFRIPPLSMIRSNRFTFLTGWSVLVLGVTGLDVLLNKEFAWWRWFWVPVLLLAVAGVWASLLAIGVPLRGGIPQEYRAAFTPEERNWFRVMYLGCAVLCAVGVGVWVLTLGGAMRKRGVMSALCLMIVGELMWNAWGANGQCDPRLYYPTIPVLHALKSAPPGRICGVDCLPPNLNLVYPLQDIRGYDGADPGPLVVLLSRVSPQSLHLTWPYAVGHFAPKPSPILDMLNLRYLVHRGVPPPGTEVWMAEKDYWVTENKSALPRVYVPKSVVTLPDLERTLERLSDEDFNPRQVVYIDQTLGESLGEVAGTARIVEECPSRVVIETTMQTPGVVVLADLWYPGWKVTVNGIQKDVVRANYAIRGVRVDAGTSLVVFRYDPIGFKIGLWLMTGAILIIGVLLGIGCFTDHSHSTTHTKSRT